MRRPAIALAIALALVAASACAPSPQPVTPVAPAAVTPLVPAAGVARLALLTGTVFAPASIVAAGGGNIVAAGAGNIVAAGGGNIVAAGGGNIVAAGGGNIVAAGGGNIVAAGGGNLIGKGGAGIVAAGGGNIVAAGGGNLIGKGGAGIVAAGGGNIVAAGGGNLIAIGANIVAAGGGNLIGKGGAGIVAAGGGNIVAAGGGNLIGKGGAGYALAQAATAAYAAAANHTSRQILETALSMVPIVQVPVAGARVYLTDKQGNPVDTPPVYTDADGRYTFPEVLRGNNFLVTVIVEGATAGPKARRIAQTADGIPGPRDADGDGTFDSLKNPIVIGVAPTTGTSTPKTPVPVAQDPAFVAAQDLEAKKEASAALLVPADKANEPPAPDSLFLKTVTTSKNDINVANISLASTIMTETLIAHDPTGTQLDDLPHFEEAVALLEPLLRELDPKQLPEVLLKNPILDSLTHPIEANALLDGWSELAPELKESIAEVKEELIPPEKTRLPGDPLGEETPAPVATTAPEPTSKPEDEVAPDPVTPPEPRRDPEPESNLELKVGVQGGAYASPAPAVIRVGPPPAR